MDTSLSSSDEQPIETITHEFNRQLHLQSDDDSTVSTSNFLPDKENDDDDFTFMFLGGDDSEIGGDKMSEDAQIRQVFPLFDQNLLLDGEYEVEEIDRLPVQPPVDKIFVQSPSRFPSSENEDVTTAGPYCVWSKESATATAELSKKSNSTGFSKLWRLKDKGGRSNSYGRDAFVFFKSSEKKTTAVSSSSPATADGTFKVNGAGGKAKVVKGKKVSAHEAYLKSRGGHTEEERRRSYLPYRPELMGFFTNVHGGLTKNVHPY